MSKIVTEGNLEEEDLDSSKISHSDEDYKYVKEAQKGNIAAINHIISKYDIMVKAKSKMYFMIGSDREDMIQEGMIGLYKAIRDYNDEKTCTFSSFASICVTRQMITAVKTSTRQKHIPLNSYVSLNKPVYDGDSESDRNLFDIITNNADSDPEKLIISKENYKNIENKINEVLTPLEEEVLTLYMSGEKYSEIANALGKNEKSIDNAMQRAKKKLIKSLEENE
ncbi:MAG: RNA polymerase sigma-H factor [Peptostreptococcus russellii]|uniref:RNA polymerase sporulation sigma factor SigH n=1 Tax=Peptostreptococcus russellii TaxID=215200 RepID=UPI000D1120EA|nr:RNA polymerase sporulation sigma factor SigH [Peptostreptococcus russellii]